MDKATNTASKAIGWIVGIGASPNDLQTQLEGAQAERQRAQDGVATALQRFDEADAASADSAAEALDHARHVERLAVEHVARAERAIERQRAEQLEAERCALQKTAAELAAQLTPQVRAQRDQPLAEIESNLLARLIEVRAQRHQLEVEFGQERMQLRQVRERLGEETGNEPVQPLAVPSGVVAANIEALISSFPPGDIRVRFAHDLLSDVAPGRAQFHVVANAAE